MKGKLVSDYPGYYISSAPVGRGNEGQDIAKGPEDGWLLRRWAKGIFLIWPSGRRQF